MRDTSAVLEWRGLPALFAEIANVFRFIQGAVMSTTTSAFTERRTLLVLREHFSAACESLTPYFDPANSWGGAGNHHHDHLALMALREQFPQFTAQESYIVLATVKRLHAAGIAITYP